MALHENCVLNLTHLGVNEDFSPGGSMSNSPEKLLQKGSGEVSMCDLGEGGMHAVTYIFLQKVSASHVGAFITVKEFSASLGMRKCMNWFHNIF